VTRTVTPSRRRTPFEHFECARPILAVNDDIDAYLAGADHCDVDSRPRERLKHPSRDARMALHAAPNTEILRRSGTIPGWPPSARSTRPPPVRRATSRFAAS